MDFLTWADLKDIVNSKGFTWFNNSTNLIAFRKKDYFDNKFSDKLFIAYHDYSSNEKKVLALDWTTLSGTLGKGGVFDPISAWGLNVKTGAWENVKGVAVLKEGQYLKSYKFVDSYTGFSKYPFFQQVAPVEVYRDGNKDIWIDCDKDATIHRGLFGINIHRMSGNGILSDKVNSSSISWSIACQGTDEPNFRKLLPIIREDVKKFGNLFTYTMINWNN